jgi:hypothetical protein
MYYSSSSLARHYVWTEHDFLLSDYDCSPQQPQLKSSEMAAKTITPVAEKTTISPKTIQPSLPVYKVVKSSAPKKRTKKFLQALQRPAPPPGKRYPVKILANGLVDTEKTPDYLSVA